MQRLSLSIVRGALSTRLINRVIIRSKTDSSIVPKMTQDVREATKEHVRELRREFDRPVQFSTSRAKYWDTADSIVFNRHIGKFTRPVLIVTVLINMVSARSNEKRRHFFASSSTGVTTEIRTISTRCSKWNRGKSSRDSTSNI